MPEPIAYFCGEFVPVSQVVISPFDSGFMLGVTVAEQLRTFGGEVFRWDEHMQRLRRSLQIVGLLEEVNLRSLRDIAGQVLQHNLAMIDRQDDLGLTIFVTPGAYATFSPDTAPVPTIAVLSYSLPFALWAHKYDVGQSTVIAKVTQVPKATWPRELKCRSRMHYYLADREAHRTDSSARAILLDDAGYVNEASTANILAYLPREGLVSPPLEDVLPGVSLKVVEELAKRLNMDFVYRKLDREELISAAEVLLTSTSPCVLPVVRIDGREVGDGRPGETFQRLLSAWSDLVRIDIYQQAQRFQKRPGLGGSESQ